MSDLWGAIAPGTSQGPNAPLFWHFWVRQIQSALSWFKAFLRGRAGVRTASYNVHTFDNKGPGVRIVGDACIFGAWAHS